MKKLVVMVGVGEMGGVFARGFLKSGYPIFPVTRGMKVEEVCQAVDDPEMVIVSVGEKDLQTVLANIPQDWKDRLVLLQNELLPRDWGAHNIINPTVISVWFEKKQPKDYKVIIPSPVYGPKANLIAEALGSINIPTKVVDSEKELLSELIIKNLYILTTNISGLEIGGNVGELWDNHQDLAKQVASDVLDIQFALVEKEIDRSMLIEGMVAAFEGDREHQCMGRSAPGRLQRALNLSDELNLPAKTLRSIQKNQE